MLTVSATVLRPQIALGRPMFVIFQTKRSIDAPGRSDNSHHLPSMIFGIVDGIVDGIDAA